MTVETLEKPVGGSDDLLANGDPVEGSEIVDSNFDLFGDIDARELLEEEPLARVLSEPAVEAVVSSVVEEPKKAISGRERELWDRRVDVQRAKEGLKFAKHGYSRKEKKQAEATEAMLIESKLKAERQASGRIPARPVIGRINNMRQNRVFRREMKNAVADSKELAKHEIKMREQDARLRREAFAEAYKQAREKRFIANLKARQAVYERLGFHPIRYHAG